MSDDAELFLPDPEAGRMFTTSRIVRTTDVTATGRLRLDGIARYLQEAAEDDVLDAGWDEAQDWLLRRCVVTLRGYPVHGNRVRLRTFCSALGPRWAERTTTLSGDNSDVIQASAVWVAVARQTGAPALLGPEFHRVYGESAQGRKVSARLFHSGPDPSLDGRPWPLRACDFDPAGHVNNTIAWAAAEDVLAGVDWLPARAEIEYYQPILPGCEPWLLADHSPARHDSPGRHDSPARTGMWLMAGQDRLASGRLFA